MFYFRTDGTVNRMNDLISRQAAIEAMGCVSDSICAQQAIDALADLPSAERRGRWLYKSELYSYCGHPFYPKICSVCNGVFEYTTNYCPNCGARMGAVEE